MDNNLSDSQYKAYKQRYLILVTVVLLNISNAALWINYSPVATTVADYYDKEVEAVNWFSIIYFMMSIPFTFISTFIVNKLGLRWGILLGASFNCFGGVVRAIGTSGIFEDLNAQYGVSLFGQVFSAIAQSFLLFIPTKVSQIWFPEDQRAVATTILAMSNPLGIVIAQAATPFIVQSPDDVPLNNYIWAVLSVIAEIAAVSTVTRSKPKTPPSHSAMKGDEIRPSYLTQLKMAFTDISYLLLMLVLGAGVGIFSAVSTVAQQMLCSIGYSDVFSGLSIALLILSGFVGSAIAGIVVDKTKMFGEVTKLAFGFAALAFIFMFEFYLVPNQEVVLAIASALFGFFGVGAYPVGLELGVEITYPVEESMSTAFVFLSAQVQGAIIVAMIPAIATGQSGENFILNVCSGDTTEAKDYTLPVTIIMAYLGIIVSAMILWMKTPYKRQETEKSQYKTEDGLALKNS